MAGKTNVDFAAMDAAMAKMSDTFDQIAAKNLELTVKKATKQMQIDINKTKPQ